MYIINKDSSSLVEKTHDVLTQIIVLWRSDIYFKKGRCIFCLIIINLLRTTDNAWFRLENHEYVDNHKFRLKIMNLLIKRWKVWLLREKKRNLPRWQGFVLLDWPWQVRTCPNHYFSSNFAHVGSQSMLSTYFQMFLHGFASRSHRNT